ncbi:hypothetical protein BARVI_00560 [Barnesiella viscericola DSM 18177]|uniref:Uncharacterized protein n=1 Tax=Barnesiella viscericola DSM 18177 TaxID=880074 RepID=W0EVE7_9BACT|nr:hypothetical protein BARVI_00560 [Barnesiella viscericola DSM 18177]
MIQKIDNQRTNGIFYLTPSKLNIFCNIINNKYIIFAIQNLHIAR